MEKLVLIALSFMVCSIMFGQTVNDLRPTVTMKEYVDMVAELNQKLVEQGDKNINDNVSKANAAIEKRFEGMNEFRSQLKDQAGTFITRSELFAWIGMVIGLFFGFSRYIKDKHDSTGKNIVSGDKVEVKK